MIAAIGIYPTAGGVVLVVVGFAASLGYARSQAQKVWREAAEGWKTENEVNKERADRLAAGLRHVEAELGNAQRKTDITAVLLILKEQHVEATEILTRIADESSVRNGHIARVLADSNERVVEILAAFDNRGHRDHLETLKAVERLSTEKTLREVADKP